MEKLKQDIRNYQLNVGKTYMQYEQDNYSQYQNYLYKRALYGLDSMTEQELTGMCSKKKQRIVNVYKRAQIVVNKIKQQATIKYTNDFFKAFFPKSSLTDAFLNDTETDDNFKNVLTFKELNIKKDQIISIFIEEGILPKNFMSLQIGPNELPRLKQTL